METFSQPQPEQNTQTPNVIKLIGPDGHIFTVNASSTVETQPQVSTEHLDIDIPLPTFDTIEQPVVASAEQLQPVEAIDGNVMMASLIAGGILRFRNRRDAKGAQRRSDASAHREAAIETLHRHRTQGTLDYDAQFGNQDVFPKPKDDQFQSSYNPLSGFGKTHMKAKIPQGGLVMNKPKPVEVTSARTRTQNRASLRANLREDAINNRVGRADKYIDLHGPVILDKKALKDEIKNGNYSNEQKKAMKQAGRKARRLLGTSARINGRLGRQARGEDLHGKAIKATQKITRN
jgi:hypothetical protein